MSLQKSMAMRHKGRKQAPRAFLLRDTEDRDILSRALLPNCELPAKRFQLGQVAFSEKYSERDEQEHED